MILLDDAQSTQANPSSRLYEQVLQDWTVYPQSSHVDTIAAVDQCLLNIKEALTKGEYVVAAFAYELGLYIHRIDRPAHRVINKHPLIQAWSFKSHKSLGKEDVDSFIQNRISTLDPESQIAGVANLHSSVNE